MRGTYGYALLAEVLSPPSVVLLNTSTGKHACSWLHQAWVVGDLYTCHHFVQHIGGCCKLNAHAG